MVNSGQFGVPRDVNHPGVWGHQRLRGLVPASKTLPQTNCQARLLHRTTQCTFTKRSGYQFFFRINVSVQLPQLKKSGAKISNWEVLSPLNLVPIFKVEFSGYGEDQRNGSTVHFPSFQGFQVLSGVHQVNFFLQKKLNQESQQIEKTNITDSSARLRTTVAWSMFWRSWT